MRIPRVVLHLSLLVLLGAAVSWLWKNAWAVAPVASPVLFQPAPKPPGQSLRAPENVRWDGKSGHLTFHAKAGGPYPTHEIPLANWPRGMGAHIRLGGSCREILPGAEEWQDGRAMLIWRQPDGSVQQAHYGLLGAEGSGAFDLEFLAVLDQPGQPSIFLQHAGISGDLTITQLEITPVGLRPWVPWVMVTLLTSVCLWWAVLFALITGKWHLWRSLAASLLAIGAFWTMVLPGPWQPLRPLGGSFVIGEAVIPQVVSVGQGEAGGGGKEKPATAVKPMAGEASRVESPRPPTPQPAVTENKPTAAPEVREPAVVPVPGAMKNSWFWESYHWVKRKARLVLHIGVFAVLTVLFQVVLGSVRGWVPVAVLGVSSEAMQAFFGFGFEWEDAGDLAVNATGIAVGLFLVRWWARRRARGGTVPEVG